MDVKLLTNSIVFAILGVVILLGGFFFFDKITPYSLWKEICEEKNVALAIVVGAISLGISIIVASAVHG